MVLKVNKKNVTVSEASEFLSISKTSVIFAIKTKKLNATRDGHQWKISIKTLKAYKELRQSALEKSGNTTGIDQKTVGINVLKREITNATVNNIRITKNFELFRGSSGKPLIDEKDIDPSILYLFCNTAKENCAKRFSHENIELKQRSFLQRMERLSTFLEVLKKEIKKRSYKKT